MGTRPLLKLLLDRYDLSTRIAKRDAVIERVKRWEGVPYYSADGDDPSVIAAGDDDPILGVNCSGLYAEMLRGVGAIEHSARPSVQEMYLAFCHKTVHRQPRRGDFLFYGVLEVGKEPVIGHVAMMVDDWHLYEAGGGSRGTDTLAEAAKRNAFVRMRPVEFRANELAAVIGIWE